MARPAGQRGVAVAASSRAVLIAAVVFTSSASAVERFDHRGAVGLLLATELVFKDSLPIAGFRDSGTKPALDLGVSRSIGVDGNELSLTTSVIFPLGCGAAVGTYNPCTVWDVALFGGYRGYFGQDRWKTFFDLDLALHVTPLFVGGPRIGFGVQYEPSALFGIYAAAVGELGFGAGLRFSAQLVAGVQLRSYLLE